MSFFDYSCRPIILICTGSVQIVSVLKYALAVGSILVFIASGVSAEIRYDFVMDTDPVLPDPEEHPRFQSGLVPLWIQALNRPEVDMQRRAAETLRIAAIKGVPDLQTAVPNLERIVSQSSQPIARLAAANALIAMKSKASAQVLVDANKSAGADFRQLVEPALADWGFESIQQEWIARLTQSAVRNRDLILAIRCLSHVRNPSAVKPLREICLDTLRPAEIRIEVASALGAIVDTGLEADAVDVMNSSRGGRIPNNLCVIKMLARHSSDKAISILSELAADTEPSVAAAALRRLNEIDVSLTLKFADQSLRSPDVRVREQGAVPFLKFPTPERIDRLADLLDDPDPPFRRQICDRLFEMASNPDLDSVIRSSGTRVLNGEGWRGHEQAARLLGALKHKPIAERLTDLLYSPRVEVQMAASWCLSRILVVETVPAIVVRIEELTNLRLKSDVEGVDDEVGHLFEACGLMLAPEAQPLMKEYIKKNPALGDRSRIAAIWSLGLMYEGTNDKELAKALIDRVNDDETRPAAETNIVKTYCIVSLGRINAVEHVDEIKARYKGVKIGYAICWAVKKLTGEELPLPGIAEPVIGSWFLEPLGDTSASASAGK
jgi:HEAT repeat protein